MSLYNIQTPGLLSFSGGRTSGFMLREILDHFDNKLPEQLYVVFANTGKEMDATLDFVRDCGERWNVKIHWIEWHEEKKIVEVNHNSASRNGEPYDKLITKRKFLPNLKKVRFKSDILNKSVRLTVSNAGVRSVDKKGSFDEFLKTVKNKNLSPRL